MTNREEDEVYYLEEEAREQHEQEMLRLDRTDKELY